MPTARADSSNAIKQAGRHNDLRHAGKRAGHGAGAFACSAYSSNCWSSMPDTRPSASRSMRASERTPSILRRWDERVRSHGLGCVPGAAENYESAIVKQPACAGRETGCSGLVPSAVLEARAVRIRTFEDTIAHRDGSGSARQLAAPFGAAISYRHRRLHWSSDATIGTHSSAGCMLTSCNDDQVRISCDGSATDIFLVGRVEPVD